MQNLFLSTTSNIHNTNFETPWFMYASIGAVLIMYAIIEALHTKKDHVIGIREATKWSIFYISLALLFAIPIYFFIGKQASAQYIAAWAIEKSLSLDNLFVISLIFTSFKVPANLQRRMLNYGIAGAIIFRLIFILAGLSLLKRFEWVGIIFGLILAKAAWNAFRQASRKDVHEEVVDFHEKPTWKFINKVLPIHHTYSGHKLTTVIKGKRMFTMMAAVIVLIEFTDILFAVDSVPAVLAVSPDKFIAYSSNVFALLGLRALFFVYQSVAEKFWALTWTLSGVLAWIAFKMIAAPLGLHIPISISLTVLATLFTGGISLSLLVAKQNKQSK